MAVANAKKLRLTIQEGSKNEESLTTACEQLHSAVESAAVEVSGDKNMYEAISARMIGLVEEYKFKFGSLSCKVPKNPEWDSRPGTELQAELCQFIMNKLTGKDYDPNLDHNRIKGKKKYIKAQETR